MNKWREIWEDRRSEPDPISTLQTLLRQDGYDMLGAITEDSWRSYVRYLAARLKLQPEDSVFDVGCGAGALLFCLQELGHPVGGIDYSAAQVKRAREVMPEVSDLGVREAAALEPTPRYTAVIACGTFLYFPDLSYAEQVLDRMAAKAVRCVALIDLPDLTQKDKILRQRKEAMGEEAYNERYAGLDHLYYSREWVCGQFKKRGLACAMESQCLEGYAHSVYRFNAFAFKA